MVRQTSIKAYRKIKESGSLSKRRWEVYDTIFKHGPMTATEVANKMRDYCNSIMFTAVKNIHSRVTELKDMNVIEEIGTRECKISKNTAIVWEVTNEMPTKLPPTLTKNKKKELTIKELNRLYRFVKSTYSCGNNILVREKFKKVLKCIKRI